MVTSTDICTRCRLRTVKLQQDERADKSVGKSARHTIRERVLEIVATTNTWRIC